jgi:serine protease Do
MDDRSLVTRVRAHRWVTFLVLLFVLGVGITIGTLISIRVDAERAEVEQLKISSTGKPLNVDSPSALSQGFAEIAAQAGPAVVYIKTESILKRTARSPHQQIIPNLPGLDLRPFLDQPEEQRVRALGSGFIVDSAGYIVTNDHVIDGANKIKVSLKDGTEYPARLIGSDADTDVAVIKIEANKPLPVAKVGDSSKVRTGEWVVAIGAPFDLSQSVTAGIISATGRVVEGVGMFNDYLQTDAAINRGNSGGPLVNMSGEVVGINTFIQSTTGSSAGVGFAIPSKVFVDMYNQLIGGGKVHRGWLGVSMNTGPMTPEMAKYFGVKSGKGVIVTELIDANANPSREGPAAKAGLQPEDVIVELDGKPIESDYDLRSAIATTPPGKKVQIKAIRKGEPKTFEVALAERTYGTQSDDKKVTLDDKAEEQSKPPEIGLTVDNITQAMSRQLELESSEGTIVADVKPGSLAEDAGLIPNDILTHVNGKAITNAQNFGQVFRALKSGEGVVIRFLRFSPRDGRKSALFTSLVKP